MTSDIATITRGEFLRGRIREIQTQLSELQTQVATGKKSNMLSGYGADTRTMLNLRQARDTTQTYTSTISQTQGRMNLTQTVLARVYELANKVKQGINTVNNPEAQASGPSSIPVKTLALNSIREIADLLNQAPDGRFLFAGYSAMMPPMIDPGDGTQATSPMGQVATLGQVPNFPLDNTSTSGDTLYDQVAGFFAVGENYYQGDQAPNARITVRIDVNLDIDYGVRADDPAIRNILQAMYAVATNDLSSTTEGGWNRLATRAATDLETGVKQLAEIQGDLGQKQLVLKDIAERHKAYATALGSQIGDIENVDAADAIQRVTVLQTQLQASYQLISQLRSLSLADYM